MLVKFKKDHLRHKAGEVASIVDASANYLIKMGVADEFVKPKEEIVRKPVDREKILKSAKKK